jgi:hypothetical protein
MDFRVLHHNQCFDGACSAAVFTKLHRECAGGADAYEYAGLAHGKLAELPETIFGPDENAIVDFKYSSSPRLTWWFDHHQSAFVTAADKAQFEADRSGRKFFDEDAISCAGFIARVGRERFGFDTSAIEDLLYWADIVDGARYESAQAAVEMQAPAMKLTLVIENANTPDYIPRIIPLLTTMPLAEIVAQPFVAERVEPLLATHWSMVELVRERARLEDGAICFDLTDRPIDSLSKFIPYYLQPEATYAVALTRSKTRTKISVGTNPWTTLPADRLLNIADICIRFGGGGHVRVGAVSFSADEVEQARQTAAAITTELRRGQR